MAISYGTANHELHDRYLSDRGRGSLTYSQWLEKNYPSEYIRASYMGEVNVDSIGQSAAGGLGGIDTRAPDYDATGKAIRDMERAEITRQRMGRGRTASFGKGSGGLLGNALGGFEAATTAILGRLGGK